VPWESLLGGEATRYLPEFIYHIHVFICLGISLVVIRKPVKPEVTGS
jgi:hypothetical protein